METLMMAVYGIGAIALLPLVACILSGINGARRKRRREQMLDRFYSKLY